MTENPTIWHSNCLGSVQFGAEEILERDMETVPDFKHAVVRTILRGEPVARELLPPSMHIKHGKDDHEFMPDYFTLGFAIVSDRFADFLRDFDTGETQFLPIDLYQSDRQTPRPDKYFILSIQSQKSCWVQEQSDPNSAARIRPGWWNFHATLKDDSVAVLASAADGADLWVDPVLQGCLFFSDRLCRALKASTLRPQLNFWRCKIVD